MWWLFRSNKWCHGMSWAVTDARYGLHDGRCKKHVPMFADNAVAYLAIVMNIYVLSAVLLLAAGRVGLFFCITAARQSRHPRDRPVEIASSRSPWCYHNSWRHRRQWHSMASVQVTVSCRSLISRTDVDNPIRSEHDDYFLRFQSSVLRPTSRRRRIDFW